MSRGGPRLIAACLLLGAALSAGACSTGEPEPLTTRRGVLEALAGAVSRGGLTGVPLSATTAEAAPGELAAALAGVGALRPHVTVAAEGQEGEQTTGALGYRWAPRPGAEAWAYTVPVSLVKESGAWKVAWSNGALAPGLQPGERLMYQPIAARRGRILGAGGAVLVDYRPVRRVGIDRSRVSATLAPAAADRLAALVGVDRNGYVRAVRSAGTTAFVEAIVLREGDPLLARTSAGAARIPGAVLLPDERPLAATRAFARSVLGSVGPATAELVAGSGGRIAAGDLTGLGGIQRSRDGDLAGVAGYRFTAAPATGPARSLTTVPAVPGRELSITLDERLQTRAEAVLARVRPASAIVALRPSTGELLAVANGPGSQGLPTATLGQFPPGSTFKVVTALGLLRAGVAPGTRVSCPPTITVDGRAFRNYDAYPSGRLGEIPLRTAFAHSCNTAMIGQAARLDQAGLIQAAGSLGLTQAPTLGVPAFLGLVPARATPVDHAATMIGQARVQASPLGMAVVAASVAAGRAVAPRLLLSAAAAPATATATPTPPGSSPAPALTSTESAALRSLMRAVVTEGSGGLVAGLTGEVAAKTGTAEYGSATPPRTHAWMIATRGDLAVSVFVQDGSGGARTAGPLLRAFLTAVD